MASGLLDLPLEVQRTLFRHLRYPTLARLRMTCRQLRGNVSTDIMRESLQQLESNWGEAELLWSEQIEKGEGVGRQAILDRWGYVEDDSVNIYHYLPCYGCVKLRKANQFFEFEALRESRELCCHTRSFIPKPSAGGAYTTVHGMCIAELRLHPHSRWPLASRRSRSTTIWAGVLVWYLPGMQPASSRAVRTTTETASV